MTTSWTAAGADADASLAPRIVARTLASNASSPRYLPMPELVFELFEQIGVPVRLGEQFLELPHAKLHERTRHCQATSASRSTPYGSTSLWWTQTVLSTDSAPSGSMPSRRERLHQVIEYRLAPSHEARREASPEGPARSFKYALTGHVVLPLAWPVEAVAIAFDGQASAFVAFNHEVDAIAAAGHLWLDAEASLDEFIEHLQLESRLASLTQCLDLLRVLSERLLEMADDFAVERVLRELGLADRTEQVHAVARARQRHVEPLMDVGTIGRSTVARSRGPSRPA